MALGTEFGEDISDDDGVKVGEEGLGDGEAGGVNTTRSEISSEAGSSVSEFVIWTLFLLLYRSMSSQSTSLPPRTKVDSFPSLSLSLLIFKIVSTSRRLLCFRSPQVLSLALYIFSLDICKL